MKWGEGYLVHGYIIMKEENIKVKKYCDYERNWWYDSKGIESLIAEIAWLWFYKAKYLTLGCIDVVCEEEWWNYEKVYRLWVVEWGDD